MKRISVREGNLPEKVKHIAINPGVLNSNAGPPEVWECRDPGELMDYVKNKEAATHTMRPFKSGDKEDDHWYVVALILEETSDAGIVIPTNKLLFSIATTSWLRQ
mgnify:CR=1 FL=1